MMQEVPRSERLAVVGNMNWHVGKDGAEYEDVHGGHGIGVEEIQWSVMWQKDARGAKGEEYTEQW